MRHAGPILVLLAAACAAPRPCTLTLCPDRVEGTVEVSSWGGTVRMTPTSPQPPIPSEAQVTVVYGRAEFVRRGGSRVLAEEGASFRLVVSTHTSDALVVSSGAVSVVLSSDSAPVPLTPGSVIALPPAR